MTDQVFRDPVFKHEEVWRIMLGGELLPIEFNSRGAALAGLEVEKRRRQKRKEKST